MLNDIEVEIVLKAKEVTGYDPTDDYQSFYEPHKEYGFHKFIPIMRGSAVDLTHKVYIGSILIRDIADVCADDVYFTSQTEAESYFYLEKTV